jgi:uncharacterized repeat protein (TIGR04138 family)
MQAVNFEEIVETIVKNDPRYLPGAYQFLREALDHTQKMITKPTKGGGRHVSGQELLEGIRDYGLSQFGPMAMSVFDEWGIHCCEDFGELVFNLVESELLRKTETDSREDFKSGYDFFQAFRKPFLPVAKQPWPTPESDLR